MIVRSATVDLFRGKFFVVSTYSDTEAGFAVLDGEPEKLPADSSPGDLGAAVRTALDRSRHGIPTPSMKNRPPSPVCGLVGVKNYPDYMKGTKAVGVYASDAPDGSSELVKVTPKRNGGGRSGFTPIEENAVTISYDSPGQLGAAIIETMHHATT